MVATLLLKVKAEMSAKSFGEFFEFVDTRFFGVLSSSTTLYHKKKHAGYNGDTEVKEVMSELVLHCMGSLPLEIFNKRRGC